ncbi:hypothetical protein BKA70DRAFT_1535790 [Coprinopsis sp. MPI-PUGE-AT-0042]|nr:hypothetical protein BKA70DRAFT_1535790 [Coprinopsis sp. MPI-PUGE-AT-0042]
MGEVTDLEWKHYYTTRLEQFEFAKVVVSVAFQTVQVFMVIYASITFLETPKTLRRGRLQFIVISWGILLLSSVHTAILLLSAFARNTGKLVDLLYRGGVFVLDPKLSNITRTLIVAAGDFLMVWRCFSLWRDRQWVLVVPVVTGMGSLVCSTVADIKQVSIFFDTINTSISGEGNSLLYVWLAAVALSVTTNIMATCLILVPLARSWWAISKACPDRKASSMYSKVTAVIIESAAPLAACGVGLLVSRALWINLCGDFPEVYIADRVALSQYAIHEAVMKTFSMLYVSFSALSPQMMIFRVTMGKSWKNAGDSEGGAMAFSQPIHFVRRKPGPDIPK